MLMSKEGSEQNFEFLSSVNEDGNPGVVFDLCYVKLI
jgi:hypothetical protein